MQVGGQHRQRHGAREPVGAMGAHAVQTPVFQRVDRRLHRRMLSARRRKRLVRLAFALGPVWTSAVLPEVIARFHESFPRLQLKIETTSRAEGLRRLSRGDSDLHCGGIDDGERLPDFLRREHCLDLTAGIVAHRDHPLLARSITFDDLAQCPWIDFDAPIMSPQDPVRCSLGSVFEQLHERTSACAGLFLIGATEKAHYF